MAASLPDAAFNGAGISRMWSTCRCRAAKARLCCAVLESDDVYVSSGSACSKGRQSGVLRALGLPKERTDSALRVSFAPCNTTEDVDAFIRAAQKGVRMLRR